MRILLDSQAYSYEQTYRKRKNNFYISISILNKKTLFPHLEEWKKGLKLI
jgi:hypothetical protein